MALVLSAWLLLGETSLGRLQANSADGAASDEIGVTVPAGGIAYGKDLHFPQTRIPSLHVHDSIWNVGGISA